jgi:hypothetical protein
MRLRDRYAGEDSGKAKIAIHTAMVWSEQEKSSLGIKGKGVVEWWGDG